MERGFSTNGNYVNDPADGFNEVVNGIRHSFRDLRQHYTDDGLKNRADSINEAFRIKRRSDDGDDSRAIDNLGISSEDIWVMCSQQNIRPKEVFDYLVESGKDIPIEVYCHLAERYYKDVYHSDLSSLRGNSECERIEMNLSAEDKRLIAFFAVRGNYAKTLVQKDSDGLSDADDLGVTLDDTFMRDALSTGDEWLIREALGQLRSFDLSQGVFQELIRDDDSLRSIDLSSVDIGKYRLGFDDLFILLGKDYDILRRNIETFDHIGLDREQALRLIGAGEGSYVPKAVLLNADLFEGLTLDRDFAVELIDVYKKPALVLENIGLFPDDVADEEMFWHIVSRGRYLTQGQNPIFRYSKYFGVDNDAETLQRFLKEGDGVDVQLDYVLLGFTGLGADDVRAMNEAGALHREYLAEFPVVLEGIKNTDDASIRAVADLIFDGNFKQTMMSEKSKDDMQSAWIAFMSSEDRCSYSQPCNRFGFGMNPVLAFDMYTTLDPGSSEYMKRREELSSW